jgi:putative ABC transport system permease protein
MADYLIKRMNRELARAKFRVAGSAALILLAVAAYVAFASMMPTAAQSLEDMVEEQNISDLIVRVGAADMSDVEAASSVAGVDVVDHRISVSSRLVREGPDGPTEVPAVLVGIEPDRLPLVNTLRIRDGDGSYFSSSPEGEALVEGGFALGEGVAPGDTVGLQMPGGFASFAVQGLAFSPEHIMFVMNTQSVIPSTGTLAIVYLPIDILREAFSLPDDYVNEFLFLFDGTVPSDAVIGSVSELLAPNVIILTQERDELYGYALLKEDLSMGQSFAAIIAFLILLAAFFVIFSFFSRTVDEQRKQIGVLKALGYSRGSVLLSYLYMAILVGLAGSVLGLLAGLPFGDYLGGFYVDMAFHSEATGTVMDTGTIVAGLVFGPATAALACAVAVWSTVSLEPHEAIKDMRVQKVRRHRRAKARAGGGPAFSYITLYTLRSMFRHRRRMLFTVLAVSFSIVLGAMSFLMVASFAHAVERSVADYEHWDVVVDFAYPMNSSSAAGISAEGVVESVQVTRLAASWESGPSSGQTVVTALPLGQTLHGTQLTEGALASSPSEVMVGYAMAKDFGLAVGDAISLDSGYGAVAFTVSGVHADTLGQVIMFAEGAESLVPEPPVIGLLVGCADGSIQSVVDGLSAMPEVSNIQLRDEMENGLLSYMTSYNSVLYAFSMVGVTISTLTMANVVFMGVLERQREYGQLRALGYSRRDMSKSIVTEIVAVVAVSAVVAAPLLYLTLESLVGAFREFWPMYSTILYPADWLEYFVVLGMVLAFGLLAAVPGIRHVNRMDIAKAVTGGRFG